MDAITPIKGPQPVVQAAKREVSSEAQGKKASSTALQPASNGSRANGGQEETAGNPLRRAEQVLNDVLETSTPPNSRLTIEIDEPSGRFVYKAINNDSGETIRQYPHEEILRLLARFREIEGLSINRSA